MKTMANAIKWRRKDLGSATWYCDAMTGAQHGSNPNLYRPRCMKYGVAYPIFSGL
jgi:hypothetical protein